MDRGRAVAPRGYAGPVMPRRTLLVSSEDELPFAKSVAAALTRFHAIECDAVVAEGAPPAGSVRLVRGKTTVKRTKRQLEITARFEVRGGAKPLPSKVVLGIEGAQDDDPSEYEGEIAESVARRVKPVFDEQGVPARRDVAIYSLWCGAPFGEALSAALSATGFQCEVRPLNPGEYRRARGLGAASRPVQSCAARDRWRCARRASPSASARWRCARSR